MSEELRRINYSRFNSSIDILRSVMERECADPLFHARAIHISNVVRRMNISMRNSHGMASAIYQLTQISIDGMSISPIELAEKFEISPDVVLNYFRALIQAINVDGIWKRIAKEPLRPLRKALLLITKLAERIVQDDGVEFIGLSLYDYQRAVRICGVSNHTVRDNLRKLVRLGFMDMEDAENIEMTNRHHKYFRLSDAFNMSMIPDTPSSVFLAIQSADSYGFFGGDEKAVTREVFRSVLSSMGICLSRTRGAFVKMYAVPQIINRLGVDIY